VIANMHDGMPDLMPDEMRCLPSIEASPNRDSTPTNECRQRLGQTIGHKHPKSNSISKFLPFERTQMSDNFPSFQNKVVNNPSHREGLTFLGFTDVALRPRCG